ncbi:ATP-binding protein [Pseudonocardiaceae bacterium YIM PH 21723]|nr:ATP-binding protein [Pseudonocardiaceae bacterium YIM PH 21723]
MFDRDFEWSALNRFVADDTRRVSLGVVSGRRRQGKTYLLRALCQAHGGFYFAADEATDAESLRRLGSELARHLRLPAPLRFDDWHRAVDALFALGSEVPVPVVIDEFPYLVRANSSLPSIIQNALAPLRPEFENSRARLLLCGSAMSFMGKLLAGNAPLRGRAGLELMVHTFDHQLSGRFWGIDDPRLAFQVNAIVGGTPAYRREFVREDVPTGPEDFGSWVARTVLSPASPLFREARYLLSDEVDVRDTAIYHSVLAAIAQGSATRNGIASFLGRKSGDLAHALTVLEDAGLISREPDAFKDNRTLYRIAEPLLTFYHGVMRPIWSDLEFGRSTEELWQRSQHRFSGNVLGPHLEHVCRYWTRHLAPDDLLSDLPSWVGHGTVNDPAAKSSHEVDVVVHGHRDGGGRELLGIGEVKWGEEIGIGHLRRLRHIRGLLVAQGRSGAETARLLLYGAAGFSAELRDGAGDDVRLVELADLY